MRSGTRDGVVRRIATIAGTVQGVGFRPFLYHLAARHGLHGRVQNSSRGVLLDVEGPETAVFRALDEVRQRPPRLARIDSITVEERPLAGYRGFEIVESTREDAPKVLVPPDVAMCSDCRREVLDPADRHFHYPFTNCTNCGPRYTIVKELPYDRDKTSMSRFALCPECSREYHDPGDRRFHAQPVACPRCGPGVWLSDGDGRAVAAGEGVFPAVRSLLKNGHIVAIKGLGGFHLACDATNARAVAELRRRKRRPAKPFALMCRDLDAVRSMCILDRQEEELLQSPEAPIVVLPRRHGVLPEVLAPGLTTLGVMLPYTPLHLMLFDEGLTALVMTSGNVSDLPLVTDNASALRDLGGIADFFLLHNRDIVNRCDDSLARVVGGETHIYRRSRGYVPRPIEVPVPEGSRRAVLGIGGEMKNAFCIIDGERAFMSPHVGELDSVEGLANLRGTLDMFQRFLEVRPGIIAYDLHPGYASSALAREIRCDAHVGVQHHHAHMASCMAENGLTGPVVAVVADGTGYGSDGAIWGFEVLTGDYAGFVREFHLTYLPLPGGEGAVRHPFRMAVAYLLRYLGRDALKLMAERFPGREGEVRSVARLCETGLNSPPTSSCGRMFDAASAIVGACVENTYEGQAAIELGELVTDGVCDEYPFELRGGEIWPGEAFRRLAKDVRAGEPRQAVATRFLRGVASAMAEAAARAGERRGLNGVVLSGGSFQNPYLYLRVRSLLREKGFEAFGQGQVPSNDGGLALGQAMIALWGCR